MANYPYAGTDYDASWRQGFAAGFLAPEDDHPAPMPLTPEQQTVYAEGVLAGCQMMGGMRVPPAPAETEAQWTDLDRYGHEAAEVGEHGLHIGTLIADYLDARTAGMSVGSALAKAGAGGLFMLALTVAIWGPTRLPWFDEAAESAVARARQALRDAEVDVTDRDLFMAACMRQDHGTDATDELTQQGWWHGRVYLEFDRARSEAAAHGHLDDVRVLRLQTFSPGTVEVLGL